MMLKATAWVIVIMQAMIWVIIMMQAMIMEIDATSELHVAEALALVLQRASPVRQLHVALMLGQASNVY